MNKSNDVPDGATHVGPFGYLKKEGKFYFIYKDGGWYALSGDPMGVIKPL
jgi:hypothetical protein